AVGAARGLEISHDLDRRIQASQQGRQSRLYLEHDTCAALVCQLCVAAELDRVPEPLFVVNEQSLPLEAFLAAPDGRAQARRTCRGGPRLVTAPLVQRPAALEISQCQQREPLGVACFGTSRAESDAGIEARDRLLVATHLHQALAPISVQLGIPAHQADA